MNQLIKKLFLILICITAHLSYAATYNFTGSSSAGTPGKFKTTTNWTSSTSTNPINFTTTGDVFVVPGNSYIDFEGATIGEVSIQAATGAATASIVFSNSGICTISSEVAPTFSTNAAITYEFYKGGTFEYSFTNAANDPQSINNLSFYNLYLSGNDKVGMNFKIYNILKTKNSLNVFLSIYSSTDGIEFTSSSSIDFYSNTWVFVTSFVRGSSSLTGEGWFYSSMTSPNYPGSWVFSSTITTFTHRNSLRYRYLPSGTFEDIYFDNYQAGNSVTLSGNITINSASIFAATGTGNVYLTGSNLETKGILEMDGTLKISATGTENVTCSSGISSIYLDQNTTTTRSLQKLTISAGCKLTMGNNLILTDQLVLSNGELIINGNELTISGSNSDPISSSGTGTLNTTQTNSTLTINPSTAKSYNLHSARLKNSTINNLTINIPASGSTATMIQTNNMTVTGLFSIAAVNNFHQLNGYSLTLAGTIDNGNGNGIFIGSSTSSLVCGVTGTIYFKQGGTDNYLKNFTVNNSKTITLGNTLNIAGGSAGNYGTVIIDTLATCSTGNNLVLKSTSGGTARIGKSPGTIVGEYKVEQYFPAERDFRFISSPVVGGTAYQWRDEGNNNSGIGTHITGASGASNNFDASTSNKPSAFFYDETNAGNITNIYTTSTTVSDDPGWASIAGGGSSNTLDNGKGYRVLIRGDRSISLTANPAPAANVTTLWVKGTYPNHSTSISVTNSNRKDANNRLYDNNGMNLIGNPFPSAIDWNVISRSNVDDGYVVYDRTGNSYKGWNGSTGSAGRYISENQAFFVYCNNSSGGSLTINEWDKYDGVGGSIFQEKLINHLKINLMYDSSYNSDTYLHFREDAKNTKDNFDIPQMGNNGTNVATIDESNFPYNINSMGAIDSFESIPLSVQGTPAATLKFSFFDIGSFYNHKIELVDTYKKTTTPITEGMIYTFDITTDSLSFKNGRFFLNFTKQEGMSTRIIQTSKIANIYPNPIQNDKLNIQLDNKYDRATYEVINLIGQSLISGAINKTKSIDIREYSNGVYFLKVSSNGTTQTIQFIK